MLYIKVTWCVTGCFSQHKVKSICINAKILGIKPSRFSSMVDNGLYFLKIIPGNLSMLTLDHFYFFNVGRNDLTVLLFTSRYTEHKLLPYEGAVSRCSLLCRSHDQNLTDDSINIRGLQWPDDNTLVGFFKPHLYGSPDFAQIWLWGKERVPPSLHSSDCRGWPARGGLMALISQNNLNY